MVIIQLTGEQLSVLIQEAVRQANKEDKQTLSSKSSQNKPLTIQETSDFTNLAVPTIYSLVSRKQIPFFKRPGSKRLYFLESDLRQWLLEERHSTESEMAKDAVGALKIKKRRGEVMKNYITTEPLVENLIPQTSNLPHTTPSILLKILEANPPNNLSGLMALPINLRLNTPAILGGRKSV